MSRPKKMPGKMLPGGGTMQRRMNGIFLGEGDLSILLIGNSLFLAIG